MAELSVLIGGKAGDGVKLGSNIIARLFNRLGYNVFVYEDYPSLVRGGHNFAVVRASDKHVSANSSVVDVLIALNQETVEKHAQNIKDEGLVIFDSDVVKTDMISGVGRIGVPLSKIARDNGLPLIVRNIISFGVLAKLLGVDFSVVEDSIRAAVSKKVEENINVARIGFDTIETKKKIPKLDNALKPLITGNEAVALGAVKAGLKAYVAYPMTPASSILHVLAKFQDDFGIAAIHPENEIAVATMAEGLAFAGVRSMVGTSGGGFALMSESLSLAGMAELPVVFVLSQRPGPATGVPTYTAQEDLFFSLFTGQGEFPRIVIAPGDADQAFFLSGFALNLAWKFQVPVILLIDKHLSESTFSASFDENEVKVAEAVLWDKQGEFKRYSFSDDGVSPIAFPGDAEAVVKASSYEHDEAGITVENPKAIVEMFSKRLKKRDSIVSFVDDGEVETVRTFGKADSDVVLVAWGSTVGVVKEVGELLGLKVVQPLFLEPFPLRKIKQAIGDAKRIICVEVNATGQLASLLQNNGIKVNNVLLKFDGRPFFIDELKSKVEGLVR